MTTICDPLTSEVSLGIVKPHAYRHKAEIEFMIRESGLSIPIKRDPYVISRKRAEMHYAEHRGKPFYDELIRMVTSGPADVMLVCGENAISRLAKLTGATDSREAEEGTIRQLFGEKGSNPERNERLMYNAFHRSDSPASARREALLYWEENELPPRIMEILDRTSSQVV